MLKSRFFVRLFQDQNGRMEFAKSESRSGTFYCVSHEIEIEADIVLDKMYIIEFESEYCKCFEQLDRYTINWDALSTQCHAKDYKISVPMLPRTHGATVR